MLRPYLRETVSPECIIICSDFNYKAHIGYTGAEGRKLGEAGKSWTEDVYEVKKG